MTPPKTFEEALQHGKTIHDKLPNVYGMNAFPNIMAFVAADLPVLNKDKTKAVFNSPKHVEFVQQYVEGYKNGAIATGVIGKEERELPQNMKNEQIAISTMVGAFHLTDYEKNAPDVYKEVKVIPAVQYEGGVNPIKGIQTFVVPKGSEHPKEAADLALFVTNPENQLEFCKKVPIFPSTVETMKDPFFTDFQVKTKGDQARKIMIESMEDLVLDNLGIPQSVPQELIEAARIDGAGRIRIVWNVIVPLLRPFIAVCLILSSMGAMQVFASIYMMTDGGPLNSTINLTYYVYEEAFTRLDMGYATAMGMVLWLIMVVLSAIHYRLTKGGEAIQ
nr:extracellular solute-binding protein [Melghirimyces profundicolus]